jgi:hypothetical protein
MKGSDVFIRKFVLPNVFKKMLDEKFGVEWHEWEPETLLQEIRRVWNVTPVEEAFEKILALQTFVTTHLFWDDPIVFENIILAFNDRHVDPDLIQACSPEEISYAITVASRINRRGDFSQEVIKYIQACHVQYGQLVYHPSLEFAQPTYGDDFRHELAKRVAGVLEEGGMTFVDVNNAVEVQQAKTKDCGVYVEERLSKG